MLPDSLRDRDFGTNIDLRGKGSVSRKRTHAIALVREGGVRLESASSTPDKPRAPQTMQRLARTVRCEQQKTDILVWFTGGDTSISGVLLHNRYRHTHDAESTLDNILFGRVLVHSIINGIEDRHLSCTSIGRE